MQMLARIDSLYRSHWILVLAHLINLGHSFENIVNRKRNAQFASGVPTSIRLNLAFLYKFINNALDHLTLIAPNVLFAFPKPNTN
jgi:hypothetical protein